MEIVKFKSMSSKYEPLPVLTALGEPILKLSPKVLSLRHSNGGSIAEFFADGNLNYGTLIFTKRAVENINAVYRDEAIEFNSAYGGNINLPTDKSLTFIFDLETLAFGTSRVASIGTSSHNIVTLAHTATGISITANHANTINLPIVIPLNTQFKVAVIFGQTQTKVIVNNQVVHTFETGYPTQQNNLFILNGASSSSSPTNKHKIYGLEVYADINHTVDDVIMYMQNM